jgi:hypothetical protein
MHSWAYFIEGLMVAMFAGLVGVVPYKGKPNAESVRPFGLIAK